MGRRRILTDELLESIYQLAKEGLSIQETASTAGINHCRISRIGKNRKKADARPERAAWLRGNAEYKQAVEERYSLLIGENIVETCAYIEERVSYGDSVMKIAKALGVTYTTLYFKMQRECLEIKRAFARGRAKRKGQQVPDDAMLDLGLERTREKVFRLACRGYTQKDIARIRGLPYDAYKRQEKAHPELVEAFALGRSAHLKSEGHTADSRMALVEEYRRQYQV